MRLNSVKLKHDIIQKSAEIINVHFSELLACGHARITITEFKNQSMTSSLVASHQSRSLPYSSSEVTTILHSTGHHRLVLTILEFYANRIIGRCSFVFGVYAFIKWVNVQLFKIMKELYII